MKNITLICLLAILLAGLGSCKKTADNGLIGNWHLVSDSTSIGGGGGPFKGGGSTYYGSATDHYNFTADGHLYVKEGSNIDTATYNVSGSKLNLTYSYLYQGGVTISGAVKSLDISNHTSNRLTLSSQGLTPEGSAVQIIILTK